MTTNPMLPVRIWLLLFLGAIGLLCGGVALADQLPPIAEIEKYLADGGSYLEETEDGWETTGFLLK